MSFVSEQTHSRYIEVAHFEGDGVVLGVETQQSTVQDILAFLNIAIGNGQVGVNGQTVELDYIPKGGDRIEVIHHYVLTQS